MFYTENKESESLMFFCRLKFRAWASSVSPVGECSGSAYLPTRGGAAALVPWQSVPRRDPQVVNRHNKTASVYIFTNDFVRFLSYWIIRYCNKQLCQMEQFTWQNCVNYGISTFRCLDKNPLHFDLGFWKFCHCIISMCITHIAENCLNCSKLYSVYHPFTLCTTIYLANWMAPQCLRYLPPTVMLVTERTCRRVYWIKSWHDGWSKKMFRGH